MSPVSSILFVSNQGTKAKPGRSLQRLFRWMLTWIRKLSVSDKPMNFKLWLVFDTTGQCTRKKHPHRSDTPEKENGDFQYRYRLFEPCDQLPSTFKLQYLKDSIRDQGSPQKNKKSSLEDPTLRKYAPPEKIQTTKVENAWK